MKSILLGVLVLLNICVETRAECEPADIVLVVDGSMSIGSTNFATLKTEIVNFVKILPITESGVHVGVVLYSTTIQNDYLLPISGNEATLTSQIYQLPYPKKGTLTNLGIDRAVAKLQSLAESRSGVPKKIVIITDGYSNLPAKTVDSAKKAKIAGVELFSLGVGPGVNDGELLEIASSSNNVEKATDFDIVYQSLSKFAADLCVQLPTTAAPTTLPPLTSRTLPSAKVNSDCAADIVLVVDASDITRNGGIYNDFLYALRSFIFQSFVSTTGTRVGIVFTNNVKTVQIPLSGDQMYLFTEINNNINQLGGDLLIGNGLDAAIGLFTNARDVSRITILVTVGSSVRGALPFIQANTLKNLPGSTPMSVYSIGISSASGVVYNAMELSIVASQPDNIMRLASSSNLFQTLSDIASTRCQGLITQLVTSTTAQPTTILPTTIPLTTTITIPANCAADVVFVVDSSEITRNGGIYNDFINALRLLTRQSYISNTGVRVGIVFTNNVQTVKIPLSGDQNFIYNEINKNVNQLGGDLLISTGLDAAIGVFNNDVFKRNVPRATILLTAGRSTGGAIPFSQSTALKNIAGGSPMSVYAIGVPSANGVVYSLFELTIIASDSANILRLPNSINMFQIISDIVITRCQDSSTQQVPISTTLPPTTTVRLTTPVTTPSILPKDCSADIVFIIDASDVTKGGNIYSQFLASLLDFVSQQDISDSAVRVGLVFTNDVQTVQVPLSGDKNDITNGIVNNVNQLGGGLLLGTGINGAIDVFNNDVLKRNAPRVTVLVTAGRSRGGSIPATQASNLKALTAAGSTMSVYSFGVASINGAFYEENELNTISTDPLNNVYQIPDTNSLLENFNSIVVEECAVIEQTNFPPPVVTASTLPSTIPPATSSPDCAVDMVFIIDASDVTKGGNVYNGFLNELTNFLSQQTISNSATRVGIVFTNDVQTVQIPLSGDQNYLLNQINNNVNQLGGGLLLATGLNGAIDVFNNDVLNRNAPRVAIVLTSGRSRGGAIPITESNNLKTLTGGSAMTVYSLGVNSINGAFYNQAELDTIASDPVRNVVLSTDTSSLNQIFNKIATDECRNVPTVNYCDPTDIVLVVDGSMSIGTDAFKKLKANLVNFTRDLPVSPNGIHVGVVLFSSSVEPSDIIPLSGDEAALSSKILSLRYPEGGTATNLGIDEGRDMLRLLGRPGVKQVMVVITDGYSDSLKLTQQSAVAVKNDNVNVYALGVGNGVSDQELQDIASSPANVQKVIDFNFIIPSFLQLSRSICVPPPAVTASTVPATSSPICAVDIVFIIDASDVTKGGNVYNGFLDELTNFLSQQTISNSATRVGIVFTNDVQTVQIPLSGDQNYLLNQINNNVNQLGGGLLLATGLNGAIDVFNNDVLNRNAPRVAIVLTSGRSRGGAIPITESNNLKTLTGGSAMTVYSLGVNSINGAFYNQAELDTIASDPVRNVVLSTDTSSLNQIFNKIATDECRNVPTVNYCDPTDIVLVVDGSMSIGTDAFKKLKANLVNFTRDLPVSPNGIHVGVVLFSSSVEPSDIIPLSGDEAALSSKILSLRYPEGGTATNLGIDEGRDMLRLLGRPGVKQVMVVITDGYSDSLKLTQQSAVTVKNDNVNVYALGVGNGISDQELQDIASSPANVQKVTDFSFIIPSFLQFSRSICVPPPAVTASTVPATSSPICAVDIVFIIDASDVTKGGNVYNGFLDELTNFLSQQTISNSATRVGIVFTNDVQTVQIPLSGDQNYLLNQINNNVNQLGGGLLLATGLNGAIDVFNNDVLNRNAPRVAIVLTSGRSRGGAIPITESNNLKTLTGGSAMTVYSLGVNSINGAFYNQAELDTIASDPVRNVVLSTDTSSLNQIFNKIATDECRNVPTVNYCVPADIVLVVDGSMSIGSEAFKELKANLVNFTRDLPVSPNGIHVGVVLFSSSVEPSDIIPLSGDEAALSSKILSLRYPEGGTATNLGIDEGRDMLRLPGRPGVKQVMVVITDGYSDSLKLTQQSAIAVKNDNVNVYALGVGNGISDQELQDIASSPANVKKVTDFSFIIPSFLQLSRSICVTPPPGTVRTTTVIPTIAPDCSSDVVFIVDASDITKGGDLYSVFLDSLAAFVNQPTISDSATRVGIVFTNDVQTVQIPLTGDTNSLLNQINSNINQLGGGLVLANGLKGSIDVFNNDVLKRTAPRVAILLTAGRSRGGAIPVTEANNLKTLNGGSSMAVYSIGVDSVNGPLYSTNEINTISSDPSTNVYQLPNGNDLLQYYNSIVANECKFIPAPVPCIPRDIVLVVDGSMSIGSPNFDILKSNLVSYTQQLPIKPYDANVGVVLYSSQVLSNYLIPLTGNEPNLVTEINNLPYPEGGTRTNDGIDAGLNMLQNGRPGVEKIMVVLTDGLSDDKQATKDAAALAKNNKVTVYVIGVGSGVPDEELNAIASGPAYIQKSPTFDTQINALSYLFGTVCDKPSTPTTLVTTTTTMRPADPSTTTVLLTSAKTLVTRTMQPVTPILTSIIIPTRVPPVTGSMRNNCSVDIVFVVDASDTTKSGDIYNDFLDSLRSFVNQQDISSTATRVGIVFTNDEQTVQVPLSGDRNFLLNEIDNNVNQLGNGLDLGIGLDGAIDVFNNDYNNQNTPRVTVVLTAGRSRGGVIPTYEANALKGLKGGSDMSVYSIGVQSVNGDLYNEDELKVISSNTITQLPSAKDVFQSISNIADAECKVVPPNVKNCDPRDIVLVVDGSQSIGSEAFKSLKDKLISFTQELSISPNKDNVGVVLYSSDVKQSEIIPLTGDAVALTAAINSLQYPEGGTMTHLGIDAGSNMLKSTNRPGVDQVMVVITDGHSDDAIATQNSSGNLTNSGTTIYAIGVGNGVDQTELYDIASSPDNVRTVTSFEEIKLPLTPLSQSLCEPVCPVDVVFVVDASDMTKSGDIYEHFLDSLRSFVKQQSISSTGIRVGVVFTNDVQIVEIPLSGDRKGLINEINNNVNQLGGGLLLGNGLDGASNVFNNDALNRNAHRVAIVLTSGRSRGGAIPSAEADNLNTLAGGSPVSVYSFGVPSPSGVLYNKNELDTISSDPVNDVYQMSDITTLPTKFDQIINSTCSAGPPAPITTPIPTTPGPECNPTDIVLVVDGSMSIGNKNFDVLKDNLITYTKQLPINSNDANVGVVLYSSGVTLNDSITLTDNSAALQTAIANLSYPEGGTHTDLGIDNGLAMLQNGRPGEDKVMIIITDGHSDDTQATKEAAAKAKDAGVTVYVVGVGGDVSEEELNDIASGPSYIQRNPTFNTGIEALSGLSMSTCVTPTPPPDCTEPLDIVLVVDGSGSVGPINFASMKQNLADLMPDLNVSPSVVHVGFVVYSNVVHDIIPLSGDPAALSTAILKVPFPKSVTGTNYGIDEGVKMFNTSGRPGVPQTIVIITDGSPTNATATDISAAAAQATSIDMYALGVGSGIQVSELEKMASDPSKVIQGEFSSLKQTLIDLVDRLCN